jgi:hypothetical protein
MMTRNPIDHHARARRAWPHLVDAARRSTRITYGELCAELGLHHRAAQWLLGLSSGTVGRMDCRHSKQLRSIRRPKSPVLVMSHRREVGQLTDARSPTSMASGGGRELRSEASQRTKICGVATKRSDALCAAAKRREQTAIFASPVRRTAVGRMVNRAGPCRRGFRFSPPCRAITAPAAAPEPVSS